MHIKIKIFVYITLQNNLGNMVKVLSIVILFLGFMNGFYFMKYGR